MAVIKERPLAMPALAFGGEASAGRFGEIPLAGHWLGDENPEATAAALFDFFASDPKALAPARITKP